MLSLEQLTVLATAIGAETDPEFVALRSAGATGAMAEWYNQPHATFIVWRTRLTEKEIVGEISSEGTTWSWPAYIARSQGERDGWARMFNSTYSINPSLPQVRQGISDIFSGTNNSAPAQRAHLLAMGKRSATRGESLYAVGTGSNASPGTLTFEGAIGDFDVVRALEL